MASVRKPARVRSKPTRELEPKIERSPITPALVKALLNQSNAAAGALTLPPGAERMLDLMPAGIFGCDATGQITFFNRHAAELWGREPRLNSSKDRYCACRRAASADGTSIAGNDLPVAVALREGRSIRDLQLRVERMDGSWFHASINIDVLRDASGKTIGAINVFHDVSQRRRAENHLKLQRDVLEQLVQGAPLKEILESLAVAMEQLSERTMTVTVLLMQPDGQTLTFASGRRCSAAQRAHFESESPDLTRDSHACTVSVTETAWSTPIKASSGKILGTLDLHYVGRGELSAAEIELAELVARSAAIAIERRMAEGALRDSETRLRGIVSQAAVGVLEASADGRITLCNQRFCDFVGYSEAELLQLNIADVTLPDDRPAARAAMARLRAGEPDQVLEQRYRHKTGATMWAVCNLSAPRDATGGFEHFGAMVMDITARKRSEHHARFLDQLSQGLAALSDPDEIMRRASAAVGMHLEVPRCSFPEWKEDLRHIVVRNGWHAPGAMDTTGIYDLAQYGPEGWRRRALAGNLGVPDVEMDDDARDYLPAIRAMQIRAYATARFLRGEKSAVSLAVTTNCPRSWAADELLLLESALARVWPLVERARAETRVRETAQRLTLAMKAGRLGDWTWDAASDTLVLSGAAAGIVGVASGTRLSRADLLVYVHDEDRERIQRIVKRAMAGRTDYQMEYRLRRPDGSYAWVEVHGIGFYDATGTPIQMIGVMQEITERKNASDALRIREAELRLISANAPAVLSHWDRDNRLLFASRAFAERWSVPPETFFGKTVAEVLGVEAFESLQPFIERVQAGEKVAFEIDGSYVDIGARYIQASYAPEIGPEGEVRGYLAAIVDMTDRRRAEVALTKSEERLRMATRTGKIGLWDWDILNNRITWTDSLYEIHGVEPGEFAGTVESFAALIHPDDRAPVQRAIQSALEHNARYELEFRAVRPAGGLVWLFTNANVVHEAGAAVRMVGATVDITARKIAEVALRESESRFRLLANHAPVGIFLTDANGDWLYVNEAMQRMAGRRIEQMRGKGWQHALHADDGERVTAEWSACVSERRPFAMEHRFVRPDQSVLWLQVSAVESRTPAGALQGHVGTAVDMTERRAAEEKLRAQEAQLRLISSNAPIMLIHCDREERFLFVNRAYAKRFGLTSEEIIGRSIGDVVGPAAHAALAPYIQRVLAGETLEFEIEIPYSNLGRRMMQACYVPDTAADGIVRGWVGTVADVTERRQTENALRESEERFRMLADNIAQFAWILEADGTRWFNQRFCDYTGRDLEELRREGAQHLHHPDHAERVRRKFEQHQAESRPWEDVFPLRGRNGQYRWFLSRAIPIRDASNRVVRWFGTNTDVTELRAAEEALRESEARFRQLADSMPQIVFAADGRGRMDYFNRRWHELTGAATGVSGDDGFLSTLHPDDRQRGLESWYACVASGEPYQIEFRFRFPSRDEYRWHLGRALPMRDATGRVVRWFGTCTDIHDWKLVQDELRRRTKSLEIINRVGTTLAAEHDRGNIVQCVIDSGREVTGASYAAFLYTSDEQKAGDSALVATSGLEAKSFEGITVARAAVMLGRSFHREKIIRVEDASADWHHEHTNSPFSYATGDIRVRSYLAVPVVSRTGDLTGGLFFADPQPGLFSEELARTVTGIAAQAAIAVDNANLYCELSRELRKKSEAEEELQVAQQQLRIHAGDLEKMVEERTKSLREAIVQMEEFSYSVSHDLRAPLRAMNAYADALIEDYGNKLDATARNYLERIKRSSQRMENLTHDVLTYSRVARTEVELTKVNVEAVLRDLIAQYADLQPAAADVIVDAPLHLIRAHESSLGQVLANLLTNAAKFVAPGVRPRIRVRTERTETSVRIWIEDNGIGIPPEFQSSLFRVFERVPTQFNFEGTGIGLAIVRRAIEKMGGTCGVNSDGRNGSRFWIELRPA